MPKTRRNIAVLGLLALFCSACGPSTSRISLEEAGLSRSVISQTPQWSISGISTKIPADPVAGVVFIHGTPGSADGWVDMLQAAPLGIYAVSIDRPGYGGTLPRSTVTELKAHAQAVMEVAAAIQAEPGFAELPLILVGHSYGGPIAAKAAGDDTAKVSAIVIAAGALDPDLEKIHWAQHLGSWQPFKFLIGHTLRTANAELMTLEAELDVLTMEMPDVKVPVFIIHGTEDDLVPYANVAFMTDRFAPGMICETQTLDGQNHFLPWNEIDAFWGIIMRAIDASGTPC